MPQVYRGIFIAWFTSFALLCPSTVDAQGLDRALLQRVQAATVMVLNKDSSGTAFCYDAEKRLFATNAHVVGDIEEEVLVVLNSGELDEREVPGQVVHSDKEADLAVIKISEEVDVTALELDDEFDLNLGTRLWALGFPLGDQLRTDLNRHPNMSFSPGRLTSLRRQGTELQLLQLDSEINPGNSGGPVINKDGNVVGITTLKISGTNLNFAIPIARFKSFLNRPSIRFDMPIFKNSLAPLVVSAKLGKLEISQANLSGVATLFLDGVQQTPVDFTRQGDEFVCKLPPLNSLGLVATVSASSGSKTVIGQVADISIPVNGVKKSIADVYSIQWKPNFRIICNDGSVDSTNVLPQNRVMKIYVNGQPKSLNLTDVELLRIRPLTYPQVAELQIEIFSDQTKLVSKKDIVYKAAPKKNAALTPPDLEMESGGRPLEPKIRTLLWQPKFATQFRVDRIPQYDMHSIPLEKPADLMAFGRQGELLVMRVPEERSILIVDLIEGKIVKRIEISDPLDPFAANKETLFIAGHRTGALETWSLEDFTKLQDRDLQIDLPIWHLAAGACSEGALLVGNGGYQSGVSKSLREYAQFGFVLLETNSLRRLESPDWRPSSVIPNVAFTNELRVSASSSGLDFQVWNRSRSNFHHLPLILAWGNTSIPKAVHEYPTSSFLGECFFLKSGTTTPWGSELEDEDRGCVAFLAGIASSLQIRLFEDNHSLIAVVTNYGSKSGQANPVTVIHNIPLQGSGSADFSDRFLFNDLIDVLLIKNRDSIQLINTNCERHSQISGAGFIRAPRQSTHLVAGSKRFAARVEAESDSSQLIYSLVEGPSGMEISPEGELSWAVPSNPSAPIYRARIKASKPSGVFECFDINMVISNE